MRFFMAEKKLKGNRHLIWNKTTKEIIVDYHQKDGKAETVYNDIRCTGFSSDKLKDIEDKKKEKKLKGKDIEDIEEIEIKKKKVVKKKVAKKK